MDAQQLEKLGLNRNESKVYFALLRQGQASAAELVRAIGVHRNIIYDNLEKLIEKGLVSYVIEGTKKKFIAEKPEAILEFLQSRKDQIDEEMNVAKDILPEIENILASSKEKQEASLFRGVKGVKKILHEILESKEFWVMGVSNDSVAILGETYWNNFNAKRQAKKIKENLLFNSNFKNVVNIKPSKLSVHRILPPELTQATEIMFYDNKVVIVVYTDDPIATVIENTQIFMTFKKQFEFLWNLSKKV